MTAISIAPVTATTVPAHHPNRRARVVSDSIQASVIAYISSDTENLKGLNQIAEPARTRSSTTIPTAETTARTAIAAEKTSNGRCQASRGRDEAEMRMGIPLSGIDSDTLCYRVVELSMMGWGLGKQGEVNAKCASVS